MKTEEIIQAILSSRRDLERDEVLKKIENKQKEAGGYFTYEAAASIVASELGVEIPHEPFKQEFLIKDVVSGLNDVTVIGRVIAVYPSRSFTRHDKKEGKVARLLIADKSGTMKVVLWDDKADLIETGKIEQKQIVKVSHAYARQGLDGKLELHLGLRGDLQISPLDINENDYPIVGHLEKIGNITHNQKRVNVAGVAQNLSPVSEFKRRDGTPGKVRRLGLRDDTGRMTVVLWNEKVDELAKLEEENSLSMTNARVKRRPDGGFELHVEDTTTVEILSKTLPPKDQAISISLTKFTKIANLTPKMRNVDVLARVIHIQETREFKRLEGQIGRVSTLMIVDETGSIDLNLWDEKATIAGEIQPGDAVLVNGAYVQERFGKISLNVGKYGSLARNPQVEESEELPPYQERKMKIGEITVEGGPITVEGTVETAPDVREVTTSQGTSVEVATFDLTDDMGRIKVSLWRKLADIAKDFSIGTRIRLENVFVKKGFSSQFELTSRVLTSVKVLVED